MPNARRDLRDLLRAGRANLFAIDPDDLLMAGHDSRFHDRPEGRVLEHETGLDVSFAQELEQLPAARIRPNRPDDGGAGDKLAQVARDVGRAAGIKRFAGHLDHRHGRLGRDAADLAPDKFIEHEIARDGDAFAGRAGQDFAETIQFHKERPELLPFRDRHRKGLLRIDKTGSYRDLCRPTVLHKVPN